MSTKLYPKRLTRLLHCLPSPLEILQGSLVRYTTTCWKSSICRCHHGHPHGPYFYLSIQRHGKTQKVLIPKGKLPLVRRYLSNWRKYSSLIRQIMDLHLKFMKKEEMST